MIWFKMEFCIHKKLYFKQSVFVASDTTHVIYWKNTGANFKHLHVEYRDGDDKNIDI